MAVTVGGELEGLSKALWFTAPDDLVFANPATGGPLAKANMSRRFSKASQQTSPAAMTVIRVVPLAPPDWNPRKTPLRRSVLPMCTIRR